MAASQEVSDATCALESAAAAGDLEARFQLGVLAARQARHRPAAGQEAVGHFEAILEAAAAGAPIQNAERVWFALGQLYSEQENTLPRAIKAYREGVSVNPLSAVGHLGLGRLLMQEGQLLGALGEFKVAIQLDPDFKPTYGHLARLLIDQVRASELPNEYRQMMEEFGDQAPQVLSSLALELMELGRERAYESMHTKGHQLKNLMALAGSRLRTLVRRLPDGQDWSSALSVLADQQQGIYEEWVGYLDIMRPERVRPMLFDPSVLVQKVAATISEVVRSNLQEVQIGVRVQSGVPAIEADERMLQEAVTNLCLNAVEALGSGPGLVQLGVGFDAERATLFIEVEDDGPGIAEEHLEHVFEPGFSTKERGNGYGLSIARRLVQAHRGQLRAKSRPGHGTVFRLDVPINFETASFAGCRTVGGRVE